MKFIKNLFSFSLLGLALIPTFSFAQWQDNAYEWCNGTTCTTDGDSVSFNNYNYVYVNDGSSLSNVDCGFGDYGLDDLTYLVFSQGSAWASNPPDYNLCGFEDSAVFGGNRILYSPTQISALSDFYVGNYSTSFSNCTPIELDGFYGNRFSSCSMIGGYDPDSGSESGGSDSGGGVVTSNGVQIIRGDQVQSMGTALATGGSGLLKIGIQLMPYAIAFTIILLIFGLIKNWSKLKNSGLGDSSRKLPGVFYDDESEDVDPYTLVDALNFYVDDEKKYYPKNSPYKHGKYFFDKKRGDIGYYYWYEGKKYTEYEDPLSCYADTLSDKEHHYKKRHGLYND